MTRYQPIFRWYQDHGGNLDNYDNIEDLISDIEQKMRTEGTKRQKTTKELQRIKDLTSSPNFKDELDIQKSVVKKLKKKVEERKTQSGLDSINDELDIPKNIDLTPSSKKEVINEVEIKRERFDSSAFIDFVNENKRRNDLYFDSNTGIPNYNWTLGLTDAFGFSKQKGRELTLKAKQRVSIF